MVERQLQASVVRWLNEQPETLARVNGPGPAHVVGDPDVYGCTGGVMFQIELKVGKNKPTALQLQRLLDWETAGAVTGVCTSLREVKALFEKAISPRVWGDPDW